MNAYPPSHVISSAACYEPRGATYTIEEFRQLSARREFQIAIRGVNSEGEQVYKS